MDRPSLLTLQCARGLAASAVAAFHLSLLLREPRYVGEAVWFDFTRRGNLGVDFFFVLSGFIIIFAHHRDIGRPQRAAAYLAKRFVRLFPVYWFYTAIFCALVMAGIGSASTVPTTGWDWLSTIALVRFGSFELPVTPAWTLIHEVAFYAVFTLLIINRTFGIVAIAVWIAPALIIFEFAEEGSRSALTTYFSPLNLNFLIGMGAYFAWKSAPSWAGKAALPLGLTLFALVYRAEAGGMSYMQAQIAYALAFGAIIYGLASWERDHAIVTPKNPLVLIGNASYTIYLTHLAFLGLLSKILIKVKAVVPLANEAIYVVALFLAIAIGCLAYLTVEKPILAAARRMLTLGKAQRGDLAGNGARN